MIVSARVRGGVAATSYDLRMSHSRRTFLFAAGRLLVALPVGWSLAGCGGSTTSGSPAADKCANAGGLVTTGSTLVFTSSCDITHTHDFTLMASELTAPPAAGLQRNTSVDDFDGHLHSVTLTEAELAMIESGATVTKTTSAASAHTHTYMFRKA